MNLVTSWFKRYLSNSEVVLFAILLVVGFAIIISMGDMLIPLLASIVIAYLLEGLVGVLQRRMPRLLAVVTVFTGFLLLVLWTLFGVLPLISTQVTQLVQDELPRMIGQGQQGLLRLPELYPDIITEQQVRDLIDIIRGEIAQFGQAMLSLSLASVVGLMTLVVYLILTPLLVFFFLKDKQLILAWLLRFLPKERRFASQVWGDVDRQIGNYVRGKFIEIIVIWSASFVTFRLFGLNYAMLLGMLVGLSVIIPYIGAAVVTFPVVLVAWFQWGTGMEFIWLTVAYLAIQAVDGNLLVPVLFSEVVNLHPVAIIVAILVFGGFWGFWGVFFAIPLATLVQAMISSWPEVPQPPSAPMTENGA